MYLAIIERKKKIEFYLSLTVLQGSIDSSFAATFATQPSTTLLRYIIGVFPINWSKISNHSKWVITLIFILLQLIAHNSTYYLQIFNNYIILTHRIGMNPWPLSIYMWFYIVFITLLVKKRKRKSEKSSTRLPKEKSHVSNIMDYFHWLINSFSSNSKISKTTKNTQKGKQPNRTNRSEEELIR